VAPRTIALASGSCSSPARLLFDLWPWQHYRLSAASGDCRPPLGVGVGAELSQQVSELLANWNQGDAGAREALMPVVALGDLQGHSGRRISTIERVRLRAIAKGSGAKPANAKERQTPGKPYLFCELDRNGPWLAAKRKGVNEIIRRTPSFATMRSSVRARLAPPIIRRLPAPNPLRLTGNGPASETRCLR
jgi:hypothetical protein